ncbi:hypothetical protein FIBSPDRAFT_848711, partial [Athelia psychrophila]
MNINLQRSIASSYYYLSEQLRTVTQLRGTVFSFLLLRLSWTPDISAFKCDHPNTVYYLAVK